jgi:RHS repeat-associated protein
VIAVDTDYGNASSVSSYPLQAFASGGNDQFQGHKDDSESGLHYNLARYYDPAISRWAAADSVTARVFDPQSLNKYAYVRNDPINHVDRDGKDWYCTPLGSVDCTWNYFIGAGDYAFILALFNNWGGWSANVQPA